MFVCWRWRCKKIETREKKKLKKRKKSSKLERSLLENVWRNIIMISSTVCIREFMCIFIKCKLRQRKKFYEYFCCFILLFAGLAVSKLFVLRCLVGKSFVKVSMGLNKWFANSMWSYRIKWFWSEFFYNFGNFFGFLKVCKLPKLEFLKYENFQKFKF